MIKFYQVKSGKYIGMWHVRVYKSGRYFHIGRYRTEKERDEAVKQWQASNN